jgi:hypothetical protein
MMKICELSLMARLFLAGIIVVMLSVTFSDPAHSSENGSDGDERGFYSYCTKDISEFLRAINHRELSGYHWYYVTRNSDGSALRIGVQQRKKLIVARCSGEIEVTDVPGELIMVDDDNRVVGWLDRERDISHYKDHILIDGPFWQYGKIDPGTRYFTMTRNYLGDSFDIYEIAFPLKHLGFVDESARIAQAVYAKGDLIYIFTEGNSVKCRKKMDCPVTLYIFKNKKYKLEEVDKVVIERIKTFFPSYFFVKDMSPWSNEAVFVEYYDWPCRSKYHEYNLDTMEREEIGYATGMGFYLQCDIIRKIMKEREKDSDGRQ